MLNPLQDLYVFLTAILTPRRVKTRAPSATPPVANPATIFPQLQRTPYVPGYGVPAPLPLIDEGLASQYVPPDGASAAQGLAPVTGVIEKIPVAGPVLALPIKIGAALADAFGWNDPYVYNPWGMPPTAGAGAPNGINRALLYVFKHYNPVNARFESADGTWPLIIEEDVQVTAWGPSLRGMPVTGGTVGKDVSQQGQILDATVREHYKLVRLQAMAAEAVNWDRAQVGADGYTLIPAAPVAPPPTVVYSDAEKQALLDDALASGAPAPTVVVLGGAPVPVTNILRTVIRTLEP
jgi:hypothetical protein